MREGGNGTFCSNRDRMCSNLHSNSDLQICQGGRWTIGSGRASYLSSTKVCCCCCCYFYLLIHLYTCSRVAVVVVLASQVQRSSTWHTSARIRCSRRTRMRVGNFPWQGHVFLGPVCFFVVRFILTPLHDHSAVGLTSRWFLGTGRRADEEMATHTSSCASCSGKVRLPPGGGGWFTILLVKVLPVR